jgi:hypothetical protein
MIARALVAVIGVIVALTAPLAQGLDRHDADDTALFWQRVKSASLVNGATGKNCCGEADAVRVKLLGKIEGGDDFRAEIVDIMRSAFGKVGDVLTISPGVTIVDVYSPYDFPIVFLNGRNEAICLAAPEGI